MKRSLVLAAVGFALLTTATPTVASPILIDFSGTPAGSFTSYTESGVTFTAVSGGQLTSDIYGNTPAGSRGLASATSMPFSEIRADVPVGTFTVSVDLGDFNADADLLVLEAYNSSNVLIGSTSLLIPANFIGMQTLTLLTPAGTDYVIFGARVPSVSGSSVYADNFVFDVAVPEPATLAVFGLMLAGGGLYTRRRLKVTVAA